LPYASWCTIYTDRPTYRNMPAEALAETIRRVRRILDDAQVPYGLMGGLSLAAWDRVRTTHDIDFLIGVDGVRVQSLLARFGAEGFRAKSKQVIVRLPEAAGL
jgi:hypothetical protein